MSDPPKLDSSKDDYKQIFSGKPRTVKDKPSKINDLPGVQPMNATTTILDDIFLWFRNRLKRMASQEGQGVDAGRIIPSIPKLLNVAGIFAQWWIPIVAMVGILVLLILLRVL